MKKIATLCIYLLMLSLFGLRAQAPQAIQYQAVIRDMAGQPISSQSINLRISILVDDMSGQAVYVETHDVTTNSHGLVTLAIGTGVVIQGAFAGIRWHAGPHFARIEMDASQSGTYSLLTITQLLSVPYALYAGSSGMAMMSTAERDAFPNPPPGMQILNTDNFCINVFTGNAWIAYCGTCTPQPDQAFAGQDMLGSIGSHVQLQGNQPVHGSGNWTVISGSGGLIDNAGQHNTLFTGHPGAVYALVWTISNSCGSSSDTVNLSFACDPQYIPADAGNDVALCPGTCTQLTASGGISYLWSTQQQQASIQVCPSQTTTYYVTVTDEYGCTADASVTVTVNPFPNADAGQDVSACAGECTQLQARGGVSYVWSTQETMANIQVCPAQTTTYTVTVTDVQGCVATDEVVVTVLPLPVANAGQDVSICIGECTQLQAGGGTSYVWNTQETTAAIQVCPAQNTTYTVTVTDTLGCTSTDEVTVTVNALPVADAGLDTAICPGTCTQVLASGGVSYLWSTQETTAGIQVCPATSTIFWVTVTDLNGCLATDTVSVDMLPMPSQAHAGPDSLNIAGTSITLQANTPVNGSGQWTIVSGQGGSIDDDTLATTQFNGQVGESYALVWTISTVCGSLSDTLMIAFPHQQTFVQCGDTLTDTLDGQVYPTVQIGTQCWMAKNLNAGTLINVSSDHTNNTTIEKYCYDNDASNCAIYGGLYQWDEMMDYTTTPGNQGICPSGWHIPTDTEWCTLTTYLDPTVNCNIIGSSGIDAGGKMKETGTTHWNLTNTGATNSSGFTALPAGYRYNGIIYFLNHNASFWSSSELSSSNGIYWYLQNNSASVYRGELHKTLGFSVRCIHDSLLPAAPQPPLQPSTINGPTDPCENETGLLYHVTQDTGVIYTWSVPIGWSITAGQGTHEITVTAGTDSGTIEVTPTNLGGSGPSRSLSVTPQVCATTGTYPVGYVHCDPANPTIVADVTNPITGRTWMDRNLGASQVATSANDADAYGDLYQWGRFADGHQCRTSATTTSLSSSDQPGHGSFILSDASPLDWRSPQNTNLWQGVSGVNNPCPSGYRLPTDAELDDERLSWTSNNSAGAFTSALKLPVSGYRLNNNGSFFFVGSSGGYWSSTIDGGNSRRLGIGSSGASLANYQRAYGISVRCLKDN